MAQLIAVAARTIVPSRMLRLLPRTPVCPTHVLGQPVVCMVLCVCHLRIIFLSPTVTLSLHCRHTTSVTSMIRVVVSDEAEPVHFAALHKASPPVNWLTRLFFFFFFYVADHAKKGDGHNVTVDALPHFFDCHAAADRQKSSRRVVELSSPIHTRLCACVYVRVSSQSLSLRVSWSACLARARNFLHRRRG